MTLEQIIGGDPDVLEKLSDAELETFFAAQGCLDITRPELARAKNLDNKIEKKKALGHNIGEELALKYLGSLGITLDGYKRKK